MTEKYEYMRPIYRASVYKGSDDKYSWYVHFLANGNVISTRSYRYWKTAMREANKWAAK